MTNNKKVISNSIIYSISGLLIKCFSFFLLPLYTAYLTTADYGITNIANSFLSTMGFVAAFSLYSTVMRFYVDLKQDKEKLKRFYGTVLLFVFLSSAAFFVVFSLFRGFLSKYVFSDIDYYPVILICLLSLIFNCQHNIYDNILRSQQKAIKCSVLTILYFFIQIGLNIYFVVFMRLGATGVLLANFIASLIYTLYFWIDMVRSHELTFCLDFKILKESLKYSIPILPHNLSTYIATLVSSVLIGNTSSLAVLGVYSVATQFGNISDTIQTYVNNAYAPWLYERLHDHESGYKKEIRSIVNLLSSVIGLFLIGISLFAQDYILLFLRSDYHPAWRFVPLIVGVYTIKIAYYFYVNILFYFKKASRMLFVATLSSSLINVFLSAFLIPAYSAYGSILADAIAMIVRVIIVVVISYRFENIGIRISDFVLRVFLIFLSIVIGLLFSIIKYENAFSIWNFAYKCFICLLYVTLSIIIPYKKTIKSYLGKLLKRRKSNA